MFSSIGIQKDFVFFNHSPGYERSREIPIGNSFQIILFGIAVFFNVFSPPPRSIISVFSLSPFFVLYIYQTGGGRKRHKILTKSAQCFVLNTPKIRRDG